MEWFFLAARNWHPRKTKHKISELRKDESEKEWLVFMEMYRKNPNFKIKLELLQKRKF